MTNTHTTISCVKQGGSGPEAGLDLCQKVLTLHRKRLGADGYQSDRCAPNLVLMQVSELGGPRTREDCQVGSASYERSKVALFTTIRQLLPLVEVFCVACNTLHIFEPHIVEFLQSLGHNPHHTFVSMVTATTTVCQEYLRQHPFGTRNKLAIFGGPGTMDLDSDGTSPYRRLVQELVGGDGGKDDEDGIVLYRPSVSVVETLRTIIWQIKHDGTPNEESQVAYARLLRDEMADNTVGLCVLACTELPLLLTCPDTKNEEDTTTLPSSHIHFIDPTIAVANALLTATQIYPREI